MRTTLTRIIGWLTLALALGARAQGQTRIEKRWPLESGGTVRIASPLGTIRVLGWDVDTLAVTARLEPRTGRFSGGGDGQVRKLELAGRAELEVRVPRNVTVWVKSTSADIEVVGVDGTLDLTSVGGTVHVVGTPQDVTLQELRVETFFPSDAESEEAWMRLMFTESGTTDRDNDWCVPPRTSTTA